VLATGAATAVADKAPVAAIALMASAEALNAMKSLGLTVRCGNRFEDKRGLSAGPALRRAQLHPIHPSWHLALRKAAQGSRAKCHDGGVSGASQVQGDTLVTRSKDHSE